MSESTKIILKPLTADGTVITVEQQTTAVELLRKKAAFKALDVEMCLDRAQIDGSAYVTMRAADRLIQRLRKQGVIAYGKEIRGYWTWVQ